MKIEKKNGKLILSFTTKEAEKIYNDLFYATHVLDGCEDSDFRPVTYKFIKMLRKTLKNE